MLFLEVQYISVSRRSARSRSWLRTLSVHVLYGVLLRREDVVLPAASHVAGGSVVADDDALAFAVHGLAHTQLLAALPHHLTEVTCHSQNSPLGTLLIT